MAPDVGSSLRRIRRRIPRSVSIDAAPLTGKKTSKMWNYFLPEPLPARVGLRSRPADISHATCVRRNQLQPLLPGAFFVSLSVPPAPETPPLQPLAEPPAPAFSPLQALLPDAQLFRVKVEPVIRPAMQKPARIFFRSATSIVASCDVESKPSICPGAGTQKG